MTRISLSHLYFLGMALSALSSIAVFSVPLPWVGMVVFIFASLFCLNFYTINYYLSFLFVTILAIALIFNFSNWSDFSLIHPQGAPVPYLGHILLRYINIIAFIGTIAVVFCLCRIGLQSKVIEIILKLGVAVAIYAIYAYFSQLLGIPELLPRTRTGTGGGEQSTTFTYAFHRAMGTFREPSHLAEWLLVPFVLSFTKGKGFFYWRSVLIAAVILLTGSMTGIVSLAFAFFIALALYAPHLRLTKSHNTHRITKSVARAIVILVSVFLIVNFFLEDLLLNTIFDRGLVVLVGGLESSNRGYVYEYLETLPAIQILGMGLGNVQINFARSIGNQEITSVLSLYFNVLYNLGILGFILLLAILSYPILLSLKMKRQQSDEKIIFFILWGYLAWLVDFAVHSEEFSVMFGVVYGLLLYRVRMTLATNRSQIRSQF